MVTSAQSKLSIVVIYPTLLGLYGDGGNAMVLARRATAEGLEVETVFVAPGDPIPRLADIYLLGGGEDVAQGAARHIIAEEGGLVAAADRGAVILAVCAGLQMLGTEFRIAGKRFDGLGIVDAVTSLGHTRAVGELLAAPVDLELPLLSGFENHSGRTTLGSDVRPLGRVLRGVGNGNTDRRSATGRPVGAGEGFVQGQIVGTYLHGPVLARNPALADLLLQWSTGQTVATVDDHTVDALRAERIAAALRRRWGIRSITHRRLAWRTRA